ncbi:MAG: hypothetical protein GY841_12005, partial [FCB group bacterium]|nr:hypothetical protein [FCB group bacterium]
MSTIPELPTIDLHLIIESETINFIEEGEIMRKVMAILFPTVLLVGFMITPVLGEKTKPRNPISVPGHLAPVYGFAGAEKPIDESQSKVEIPQTMSLGILPTSSPGTQIGATTYDAQHNCTMARQIEHRGNDFLSTVWMQKANSILGGNRDIAYTGLDLNTCFVSVTDLVNSTRAGYTGVDVDPATGCPIVTGHESFSGSYYPTAYFNSACPPPSSTPAFGADYPSDNFGWWINDGTGPGNENLWPKIEWQVGTETVLHMVAAEFGSTADDPQTISYYRKVFNAYNDDGGNAWSAQAVIDTVTSINATVVASPNSDRVAIVWAAPCDYKRDTPDEFTSQYTNDIWYAIADDQGTYWANNATPANPSIANLVDIGTIGGGNITNYAETGEYKAYCDISAVFDAENRLHMVWNARHWSNSGVDLDLRNSALFHWRPGFITPNVVVIADWDDGIGEGHAWGADVSKPSISVCDGNLFVLYTQFGNADEPSTDMDFLNGLMNGELYLAASDDQGASWGVPQNLTNSETPGCFPGDCDSDYWASMARYGRPANGCGGGDNVPTDGYALDILYINDKEPGAVVQPESGSWTTNPVMWLTVPCRGPNVIDCTNPIAVDLSVDLPYVDNNTTCGRGNSIDETCMNPWDDSEDIVYQLTVASEMEIDVLLDPHGHQLTGMAIFDGCPTPNNCLATGFSFSNEPCDFSISLTAGIYFMVVDGIALQYCNPSFELTIQESPVGGCCFDDGSCTEMTESACELAEGTYSGDGTICAGDNDGNGVDDLCEAWQAGDDHKMHFPQLPDGAGWDVYSSVNTSDLSIADDWECSGTGWVKDLHFWGSWFLGITTEITSFEVSVYSDVPAGTDRPYSYPGDLLHTISTDSFTVVEIDPGTPEGWYNPHINMVFSNSQITYSQYDIHFDSTDWFWQDSGSVYWISISATTPGYEWGWKSSQDHWNDQAVYKDMSGDWKPLYEPGTFILGDVNHDGVVDPFDVAYLNSYLGSGSPPPYEDEGFYPAADVDGDCDIDDDDVDLLGNHVSSPYPDLIPSTCEYVARGPLALSFVITAGDFICGDANGDGTVNVGDAVHLINYVFKSGPPPEPLLSGDCNCDGVINV